MSISSIAQKIKKAVTALVGAALVAGSLVATTPANAVAPVGKQPAMSAELGYSANYSGPGRVVVKNGWAYTLLSLDSQSNDPANETFFLKRTKLATMGAPITLMAQSDSDSSKSATSVGATVTKLYKPISFDVVGNSIFVLDVFGNDSTARRLIQIDISSLTDTSANLSGTVIATTDSELSTELTGYGNTTGFAAASETSIFISNASKVFNITKSAGSWSSDAGTTIANGEYVWGLKLAGDGKLVVALSSSMWNVGNWTFKFFNTSDLTTATATASLASTDQGNELRTQDDFAVDPVTNDIVFINKNGARLQRLVKASNGTYGAPIFEAMGGATAYTAATPTASNPPMVNGWNYYEANVTESLSGLAVGAKLAFGGYTCTNNQPSCYFYANGDAYVTAVSGSKVTFKLQGSLQGNGYATVKLLSITDVNYITGLTIDSSAGLVALDAGERWITGAKSSVLTFKTRGAGLGVDSLSVTGSHKVVNVNYKHPGFVDDIESQEVYVYEGATAAAALALAASHNSVVSPTCTWSRAVNGQYSISSGSYTDCYYIDGATPGKFYAAAVKQITVGNVETWTVSSGASAVQDSAYTVGLPTEPDPVSSNVGPGYVHQGQATTTALELIASGYSRQEYSDGRGGKFVGFLVGRDFKSRVKVVHILNDGSVDATFGTGGILDVAGQALESSADYTRALKLGWYADGQLVYVDHNDLTNKFNVNFNGNAWTLSESMLSTTCASAFPGALNGNVSVSSVEPVSAASQDPILEIRCDAIYAANSNDYSSTRTAFDNIPVYVKVTGDETVSVLAAAISGVSNYTEAGAIEKPCIGIYSSSNHVVAKADPGAGEPLFTALLTKDAETNNSCNNWSTTKIAYSLQVFADGTVSEANNGLPTSNYPAISGSWVTSTGKTYLQISGESTTSIYRLTNSGELDNSFATNGFMSISAPACAGVFRLGTGISESNAGDVYFNALSWANQVYGGPNTPQADIKVYPFALLVEKASANEANVGKTYLGATLTYNKTPLTVMEGEWTNVGTPFSVNTISPGGTVNLGYYAGASGLKNITVDSFTLALPAGDDFIECPPAPFENVTSSAPVSAEGLMTVQMTDGKIFAYHAPTAGQNVGKATIFTPGSGSNLKSGTFELVEASNFVHSYGWVVALPGNKVMVGGGLDSNYNAVRSIEVFDPAADVGSKWTTLTGGSATTDLLANKTRRGARAQLLSNGKILVFGGNGDSSTATYGDGELVTPGDAGLSSVSVAFTAADTENSYSNIISAGAGKWLLFGTYAGSNGSGQAATTRVTKIYTESTGLLSNGPQLGAGRMDPAVVYLGGTKTLIAGDNTMMMGPNTSMTPRQSFDVYDSSNNSITTKTLTPGMNGYFDVAAGALLPSGKVLLVQTRYTMDPAQTKVLDINSGTMTNGVSMTTGMHNTKLYRLGEKVLLAGGRDPMNPSYLSWRVFTEPVAVAGSLSVDARKVLKGTSGTVKITAGVNMTIGSGSTALTVVYTNGVGAVLKTASVSVTGASKLKIDATGRVLSAPLPATSQINAGGVGTVIAEVKQGTTSLGTVTINYVATKDTPAFAAQIPSTIPGNLSSLTMGVTTSAGNGTPVLAYKSATTKVCTVNVAGVVTRVSRGLCKVTVSQAADLGTSAKSQDYSFTFAKSTSALAFGGDTPAAGDLDRTQDDIQIAVTSTVDGAPADLDVSYAIDNDDKCSIDEEGVLNTLADGSCKLTVTYAGDANNFPTTLERTYNIVTPSVENPGTVGGPIGDAVFEEKDEEDDTMLTTATAPFNWKTKKVINFGRGLKVAYTPVLKAKSTTVYTGVTLQPSITSAYIGLITTKFTIPVGSFSKAPAGWTANAKVGATFYQCTLSYGSKTQVAANKKIKTVISKGKTCTLPVLANGQTLQVKVKTTWTRLGQKKGSPLLTAQKRTAKINLQ